MGFISGRAAASSSESNIHGETVAQIENEQRCAHLCHESNADRRRLARRDEYCACDHRDRADDGADCYDHRQASKHLRVIERGLITSRGFLPAGADERPELGSPAFNFSCLTRTENQPDNRADHGASEYRSEGLFGRPVVHNRRMHRGPDARTDRPQAKPLAAPPRSFRQRTLPSPSLIRSSLRLAAGQEAPGWNGRIERPRCLPGHAWRL